MTAPTERLLEERHWLQGLARRLVGDADAADLVQETYLAALKSPPRDVERPLRPWLRSVLRNAALMRKRSAYRRTAREEVVCDTPSAPTPEVLVRQVDVQRQLAECVLALEEPYRQTILLRYVEGLSAAEIARRECIPAGTVRWRLKVALDDLRTSLDRGSDGDREAWRLALAPVSAGELALPRVFMQGVTKLSVGAVVLVALAAAATSAALVRGVGPDRGPQAVTDDAPSIEKATDRVSLSPGTANTASPSRSHGVDSPRRQARERLMGAIEITRGRRLERARQTASLSGKSALPAPDDLLDKEYVREQLNELTPLLRECYQLGLVNDPTLAGVIFVAIKISGEPDVGGFVEESEIDEQQTTLTDETVLECARETMYGAEFEPPAGGGTILVRVSYTFGNVDKPE